MTEVQHGIEDDLTVTYVGGPTALLDVGGVRVITDPTFDPAGSEHPAKLYVLRKTQDPAVAVDAIESLDVVLLSHDHHADNLDVLGRSVVARAARVITTVAGAERLGGSTIGLSPWESIEIPGDGRRTLVITATPARHGPVDGDRGPVIGFVMAFADEPRRAIYVSGDTVWYRGVEEVARRFDVRVAFLFIGAARVIEVGPAHLTMTAAEAVEAARAFTNATILPLHFEGWKHLSEARDDIVRTFAAAGLAERLRWPPPGKKTRVELI
jgi:L-ascorbate metabolism protein UlaG (beta-lactamase superfamily)